MGGPGYGTGAPIQPYGPSTPTPFPFLGNMQYPNPSPNPGSNWQPPPPAGPPFSSQPGYGVTNPITYPPPPPPDPYGRPPSHHDGPHGMQPGYGRLNVGSSYAPYGNQPGLAAVYNNPVNLIVCTNMIVFLSYTFLIPPFNLVVLDGAQKYESNHVSLDMVDFHMRRMQWMININLECKARDE